MPNDTGGKDKDTGRQDPPKDDPGEDEDPDDEDDDSGDGGKEWKPPTKEEFERLQRTAQRRKDERAQARRELAELRKGKPAPKKKESEDDSGRDDEAAKEADRWRGVAVKQAAAAALSAAGFTGTAKQAARLTKLMDLEDAEPGRGGEFDFEDEVEELREEFPHLFEDPRAGKRTAPKVRTATGRGDGSKPDPVKRTSDRLLKSAGYR